MLPTEALYDWQLMVDTLAAEAPWWTPGQGHGYEAITYGWLVGELLRRAPMGVGLVNPLWRAFAAGRWAWTFMWAWRMKSFIVLPI